MDETIKDYIYNRKPIGKGSFSVVYLGKNKITNKEVAIKKISISFDDNVAVEHIDSEIKIMRKTNHPNIVKLYDHLYDRDGNIYLIMEYCEKGNLSNLLNGKPLKEKYAQKFMRQIVNALEYLFINKIIHRDIKPQNIMVTNDNVLKLSDFGFAKFFKDDIDDMSKTICGSPIYMAPEIIMCKTYSNKIDLWSIGVILYEMIIGKPPYRANNHI